MRHDHILKSLLVVLVLTQITVVSRCTAESHRRVSAGDDMPEFSVTDGDGKTFQYKRSGGKAAMVVFLSTGQKRSSQAVSDIERTMLEIADHADSLDVVLAITLPRSGNTPDDATTDDEPTYESLHSRYADKGFTVVSDEKYTLWGKFGTIVTPTVLISDKNGKVVWVKAGYGYDFKPTVETHIKLTLGITRDVDPDESGKVKTMTNATVSARVQRHLRMAEMLKKMGRDKAAQLEIEKARQLDQNSVPPAEEAATGPDTPDPNSISPILTAAIAYCQQGKGQEAIKTITDFKPSNKLEQTKMDTIAGWANRIIGNLDTAQKHLLQAVKQDPASVRALYELGQVYEAKGDVKKALEHYHLALRFALKNQ